MLTLITTARPMLENLATRWTLRNTCCLWPKGGLLKKMSRRYLTLSLLRRAFVRLNFLCSAGKAVGVMAWAMYGASRCNMLGESFFFVPCSICAPSRVGVLDSSSTLGDSYCVIAKTVRTVPHVLLLQLTGHGSRPSVGAHPTKF